MKPTQDSCYAEGRAPQIFLSLETPRERRALPYTLLLEVEISLDSSLLKLVYSHYEVLVRGSELDVIYESVRAASCAAIKPGQGHGCLFGSTQDYRQRDGDSDQATGDSVSETSVNGATDSPH